MDLNKIELFMNQQCWGSVRNLTINGYVEDRYVPIIITTSFFRL